ncbi:Phage-related protein [Paenibacillus sophorae]|uniref:Phage tail family protein n=1 Tax=Paenibacillus sophorae TaxID=1333845 RepID=A0A1H8L7J4_9BACL|nr:phage tail domain-containing protein [Paenibacillus sophorae]QWU17397.1 phage tail family protein [Paenibacillus sophorae]SEO01144.1 Phage-related protein [Paenibacillus sophorae]
MEDFDVSINGQWLSEIGAQLVSRDIPMLPETEENAVKLAGRDGQLNFGSTYGARPIGLGLFVMGDDYDGVVGKLASIINIRRGTLVIVFSDRMDKRYMAEYRGFISFDTSTGNRLINVPLKMDDPFPESRQTTELREYGEGLEYGQGYFYISDSYFTITASGQTVTVNNDGSDVAYPLIRITGAFTDLSLSDGDQAFTFSGSIGGNDVLEIDCNPSKCRVRLNGQNAFSRSNGVFFALAPGETTFTVSATSPSFTLEIIYRYKYLF